MSRRGAWRIGGYVADELIGYGASAQVWRGHVGRGGEAVALKVLDLSDAAAVRAARAEAAVLSALDHPHLIRLRELLPDGESVVLVLELAAGGSLADLLARRGRLSPGEVVVALSPIAAALAYAHDAGVVHSDVSPANVLFRSDGSPLLADLGVARLVGGFDAPRSTLAYIDPGVAAGGVPSDASDVFMVAATALHALTGAPPWSGNSAEAILDQAAEGDIPGLEQRLAGISVSVADIVRRGLDPSPAARGSAAEFALDLRHATAPVPVDLDAGPSPTRPGDAGSVFYAAVGEFDAVELAEFVDLPDVGTDCPVVVDVGTDGPLVTDGGPDGAVDRVREALPTTSPAPGPPHVPRHAAPALPGSASVGPAGNRPPPVVLERPDFTRPPGTRARPVIERSRRVGRAGLADKGVRAELQKSHVDRPSDVRPRADSRSAARSAQAEPASPVHSAGPVEPPLALTHIVRARVRSPEREPPRLRFAGVPHWKLHAAVAATVVLLVAGGVLAAWLRWARTGSTASRGPSALVASTVPKVSNGSTLSGGPTGPVAPVPTVSSIPTASKPSATAGPTRSTGHPAPARTGATTLRPRPSGQGSTGSSPSTRPTRATASVHPPSTPAWPRTGEAWVALLSGLDRRRQAAFATNDPAPLADVYANGVLLDQDRRTLEQVVPPGCRLLGLRTSYRDVHVSSVTSQQSVLVAQASLSASQLQCPRQPTRAVSAQGPVAMTLVLAPVGPRVLIAGISTQT